MNRVEVVALAGAVLLAATGLQVSAQDRMVTPRDDRLVPAPFLQDLTPTMVTSRSEFLDAARTALRAAGAVEIREEFPGLVAVFHDLEVEVAVWFVNDQARWELRTRPGRGAGYGPESTVDGPDHDVGSLAAEITRALVDPEPFRLWTGVIIVDEFPIATPDGVTGLIWRRPGAGKPPLVLFLAEPEGEQLLAVMQLVESMVWTQGRSVSDASFVPLIDDLPVSRPVTDSEQARLDLWLSRLDEATEISVAGLSGAQRGIPLRIW